MLPQFRITAIERKALSLQLLHFSIISSMRLSASRWDPGSVLRSGKIKFLITRTISNLDRSFPMIEYVPQDFSLQYRLFAANYIEQTSAIGYLKSYLQWLLIPIRNHILSNYKLFQRPAQFNKQRRPVQYRLSILFDILPVTSTGQIQPFATFAIQQATTLFGTDFPHPSWTTRIITMSWVLQAMLQTLKSSRRTTKLH